MERGVIRAAAVSALAAFANGVPSLRRSVLHLIRKCLDDSDDEVRERAYFFIVLIERGLAPADKSVLEDNLSITAPSEDDQINENGSEADVNEEFAELRDFVFDTEHAIDVNALESYLQENGETIKEQEDLLSIDLTSMVSAAATTPVPKVVAEQNEKRPAPTAKGLGPAVSQQPTTEDSTFLKELRAEESMADLLASDKHIYSTAPQQLTEQDAEYVIQCVKHVFEAHVILQYEIHNSIEDQILSKVNVKLTNFSSSSGGVKVKGAVPLNEDDQIKYDEKKFAYVVLKRESAGGYPSFKVEQLLTF